MVCVRRIRCREQKPSMCLFEHVYFARPDSLIYGQSVNESRHKMGKRLAIEQPADADLVVPVPDSGTVAAIGYSAQSKISFRFGLVRNHYVGRTFIEPRQSIRSFGVRIKLNPVRAFDRGQTSSADRRFDCARHDVEKDCAGWCGRRARKRFTCASVVRRRSVPCYYGIDTPKQGRFDCRANVGRGNLQVHRGRLAWLSFARRNDRGDRHQSRLFLRGLLE